MCAFFRDQKNELEIQIEIHRKMEEEIKAAIDDCDGEHQTLFTSSLLIIPNGLCSEILEVNSCVSNFYS